MNLPPISDAVLASARDVWDSTIEQYGRMVQPYDKDDQPIGPEIKAFAKRPKILGLFDRTQASYDQERYMVMVKASDVTDPSKFMRFRWDEEDHTVISVTKVELLGIVFGYRILVKG